MSGRALKNYDKYLQQIELYARALKVEIIYKTDPSDGAYDQRGSKLTIDPDLSESCEIATLLHELGHATDYSLIDIKSSCKIFDAYSKVYDDGGTKKDLKLVIESEVRAWDNGILIAKRLKIKLGKWYYMERESALNSYKEV